MAQASKEKVIGVMSLIQNLSADEQGQLQNMFRKLEAASTDEQVFTNVTKAMQAAGWNPFKRAYAGGKTALRNRMESTKGINSRATARAARLFGFRKTADFIDRWLTGAPKKKLTIPKGGAGGDDDGSSQPRGSTSGIETTKGLLTITKQLGELTDVVNVVADDVTDIKSLLMPKFLTAKGEKGTGDEGNDQIAMYNPLAPQGQQFRQATQSGKITALKPGKNFEKSAMNKAAVEAATLALAIRKKDEDREARTAELRKKFEFKEEAEKYDTEQENPCADLREHMDKRFDKIEENLRSKNGLWGWISAGLLGLWARFTKFLSPIWTIFKGIGKAIAGVARWGLQFGKFVIGHMWKTITSAWRVIQALGTGIGKLVARWFPGLTIPGLVAGGAAVATTAAIGASIDRGMKQVADKSIDKITADVTATQKREKFDPEQSYEAYKLAIDEALASPENASQERQDYIKQQLTKSEGLGDLEKRMAARYYYEKEGGESSGPTSRGGRRNAVTPVQDSIPAEIIAEGSDTVDTNYAHVPVAPAAAPMEEVTFTASRSAPEPKAAVGGTGTLEKQEPVQFTDEQDIKDQIKKHEGWRAEPYKDSVGKWTIGYGHLLGNTLPKEWQGKVLTQQEGDALFEKDYAYHRKEAAKLPGFDKLNKRGKKAMIDLTFNMGPNWVRAKGFKRFEKAMSQPVPDIGLAVQSLEDSKWYDQVKSRAPVIVNDLRAGLDTSRDTMYANKTKSTATPALAQSVTPASVMPAVVSDKESRALMASTSGVSSVTVVGAPTNVQNTQVNNTVSKRPAQKASVLAQDSTLNRTLGRDVQHPVLIG